MITDVEDTRIVDEHFPLSSSHQLFPRKGGGGGGGHGGGRGGGKSGKGTSGGKSTPVNVGGQTMTARASSPGGGRVWYGSGFYDSNDDPGVAGRNLTFLVPASNANRPGGPLMSLEIPSMKGSETFRIISDEFTVDSLSDYIKENCKDLIGTLSSLANISDSGYKALLNPNKFSTTIVLLSSAPGPSVDTDAYKLVECLNWTIVDTVPLFDSAFTKYQVPGGMTLALILVVIHLLR
ncbi:unnamed protein product [Cyclocybe aegerita]|uniref:Uncharacterized protein n=1 Tax=Cyclocybe aegerita TaxID=1973307 RepID=A0A8S0XNM6_CYCAE|nr:unnamed protein product [Cyclocybe aegerita]